MEQPEAKNSVFLVYRKEKIEKLLEQKDSQNTRKVSDKSNSLYIFYDLFVVHLQCLKEINLCCS